MRTKRQENQSQDSVQTSRAVAVSLLLHTTLLHEHLGLNAIDKTSTPRTMKIAISGGKFQVNDLCKEISPPRDLKHNCHICDQHFRTRQSQVHLSFRYIGVLDDVAAAQSIRDEVASTAADLEYVKAKLRSHGDLILARWTKRSKEKRGMFLSSAAEDNFGPWPPGPRSSTLSDEDDGCTCGQHRRSHLEQAKELARQQVRYGCFWFGDWLQIEDFARDRSKLLTLLHLRTAYPPSSWAIFDTKAASIAWDLALCPVVFNDNGVRMTGDGHGTLTDFSHEAIHMWSHVGYPRAKLTFWSQSAIARGLRNLVDGLVDGAEAAGTPNGTSPPRLDLWVVART